MKHLQSVADKVLDCIESTVDTWEVGASDKQNIRQITGALKDLQDALKGSDAAAIKAKEEALMKAMEPIAQAMYANAGAAGAQGAGPQPGDCGAGGCGAQPNQEPPKKNPNDDAVDADYTMK